ncbi:MAG TPA: helix-turn-helix domain-containing protein [Solirubrobacterales bacterium]|nr:helix-turn-helix domain-containing protein [Solirubrobacterales bacterium]
MDVQQLPRGRHRLAREEVLASQRGRMLVAMSEAVAERGYAKTSVAEVLKRARVSRETFYEHFQNKEQCFNAAYDGAAMLLATEIGTGLAASSEERDVAERLNDLLRRYLETLQSEPALARTFLVEVYAAGPDALERRVEVQNRFVDLVAFIAGAKDEKQRFACETIVAAVSALVTQRVCAGKTHELTELEEPLTDLVTELLEVVGLG